jgi:hypothetical protein
VRNSLVAWGVLTLLCLGGDACKSELSFGALEPDSQPVTPGQDGSVDGYGAAAGGAGTGGGPGGAAGMGGAAGSSGGAAGVAGAAAGSGGAAGMAGAAAGSGGAAGMAGAAGMGGGPVDPLELACIQSGGTVAIGRCCGDGGNSFPNQCSIGPCGCAPEYSADTKVCYCATGRCFDGTTCVPSP